LARMGGGQEGRGRNNNAVWGIYPGRGGESAGSQGWCPLCGLQGFGVAVRADQIAQREREGGEGRICQMGRPLKRGGKVFY